ncbi:MAG: extracellular solute-binding protein [Clostridiales bacterium]|nr:extracellular solute-binding protein [Clostridiales bacterium]
MRKKISVILCTVLSLCVILTSCHGATKRHAFTVPKTFDESRQYEITFWAKNDTNVYQTRVYDAAIASFEALYPNIHVNMRLYTDYGRIYNDVITNIATDTTPNVCITYPDHIATYMTGDNVVVPLDSLIEDPSYGLGGSQLRFESPTLQQMVPEYMEEGKIDGVQYAIPFMRSTEALYINKTYVEALGYEVPDILTWDFVWEVSEAAMARNPDGTFAVNGQMTMIPFIYKSSDNMMIQMLRQLGAGYSTSEGNIEIFNDDTRGIIRQIAEHTATGAFSTFKISGYPANFLNAGQCIFAIDSTAGSTWMGSDAPNVDISENSIVRFETAVRPIPQYDTSNPQMISQGPSICIFNKADDGEVLASWLFAQYLLTNDVQLGYSATEGYVPVTLMARESSEYQSYLNGGEDQTRYYPVKLQASRLLIDYTSNTFVTPVFNGSTSLRDAAGSLIDTTVKAVNRHNTVDDAYIDQLFSDVYANNKLDQIESTDLGPMPKTSVAMLTILAVTWVFIVAYVVFSKIKAKKL